MAEGEQGLQGAERAVSSTEHWLMGWRKGPRFQDQQGVCGPGAPWGGHERVLAPRGFEGGNAGQRDQSESC